MNTLSATITPITPIHIGTGEEWKGNIEFLLFQEEAVAALVDERKVLDIIGEENLQHWVTIIEKEEDLLQYLQQRKPGLRATDVARRILLITGKTPSSKSSIKAQFHTGADPRPAIPGSSVKGAIRTALLTHLILNNPEPVKNREMLGRFRRGRFKYQDSQIQARYLGAQDEQAPPGRLRHSPNKDLLRFLRVFDFQFDRTEVFHSSIINKDFGNWKHKEQQYLECIPAQSSSVSGSIQLPKALMNQVDYNGYINKSMNLIQPERLFKIINKHTRQLIQDELDLLDEENYPEEFENYEEQLNKIEEELKKADHSGDRICVFRLGAGSGWDYMTGAWSKDPKTLTEKDWYDLKRQLRWKNYPDHLLFPKTRKLLDGGVPLGFAILALNST